MRLEKFHFSFKANITMNTIDLVQSLEEVDFTRKQAERQVTTILDIKKGLATQKDVQAFDGRFSGLEANFEARFKAIDQRFEAIDQRFEAIDKKFEAIDKKFEAIDQRFEAINIRFDAQDKRIDALPFKTSLWVVGMILTLSGLIKIILPFIP